MAIINELPSDRAEQDTCLEPSRPMQAFEQDIQPGAEGDDPTQLEEPCSRIESGLKSIGGFFLLIAWALLAGLILYYPVCGWIGMIQHFIPTHEIRVDPSGAGALFVHKRDILLLNGPDSGGYKLPGEIEDISLVEKKFRALKVSADVTHDLGALSYYQFNKKFSFRCPDNLDGKRGKKFFTFVSQVSTSKEDLIKEKLASGPKYAWVDSDSIGKDQSLSTMVDCMVNKNEGWRKFSAMLDNLDQNAPLNESSSIPTETSSKD